MRPRPKETTMSNGHRSVLFVGGTGTISFSCVRAALSRGWEVSVLNRGRTADIRPLPDGVRLLVGAVRDGEAVRAALGDRTFSAVVDFLCFDAEQAAAAVATFRGRTAQYVLISSASVYRKPPGRVPFVESTPRRNPFTAYSRDKIAAEAVLERAYDEADFPVTIVRPSHTYDHGSMPLIGQWTTVERMRQGRPVIVHGDGSSLWTLTHARDFAKGFVPLLCNPRAYGESFHITSDEAPPWNAIHRMIATAAGVGSLDIVHVPSDAIAAVDRAWGDALLGDMGHSLVFDNSKLRRLVPDFACTTTFAEGVRETVAWFDANPAFKVSDADKDRTMDWLAETYRPRAR
jgi:nucleoside-diphosphate-sugar epimerase